MRAQGHTKPATDEPLPSSDEASAGSEGAEMPDAEEMDIDITDLCKEVQVEQVWHYLFGPHCCCSALSTSPYMYT